MKFIIALLIIGGVLQGGGAGLVAGIIVSTIAVVLYYMIPVWYYKIKELPLKPTEDEVNKLNDIIKKREEEIR